MAQLGAIFRREMASLGPSWFCEKDARKSQFFKTVFIFFLGGIVWSQLKKRGIGSKDLDKPMVIGQSDQDRISSSKI